MDKVDIVIDLVKREFNNLYYKPEEELKNNDLIDLRERVVDLISTIKSDEF